MPINKKDDGRYCGSKGPFKSKDKAEEVQRAAYASGYHKMEKASPQKKTADELRGLISDQEDFLDVDDVGMLGTPMDQLRDTVKRRAQERAKTEKVISPEDMTEDEVAVLQAEATRKREETKQQAVEEEDRAFAEAGIPIDPLTSFQAMLKEGDGAGIGTVAVSSDPGVFTDTYGERKRKIMSRKPTSTSKSNKSGPEKLDDFLNNSYKSLDDESFLLELVQHVGNELRKAGEGPTGTYTPYNERPYQPAYPQELKQKSRNRNDEINRSPTTENTVPVSGGEGSLGQSKVPQETVLAPPGVDDARNMNRTVKRKRSGITGNLPTGAYLNPGDESGMNFQAMQKMPTHGNVTANTPKQFSTQRPQEQYIERKPRLDPNSDVEQEEFVGNVDSIRDEDKNRKGRTYENNKEGNNFNSKQVDTYAMNMGGHALQALNKEMRPVGLDSLHRETKDDITEPDKENTKELKRKEEEEIPEDKDIIHAEKSAVQKMLDWFNDL